MSATNFQYKHVDLDTIQGFRFDEAGEEREIFIQYGIEKDDHGDTYAYLDSVNYDSPTGPRIHPADWTRKEHYEWLTACEDHDKIQAEPSF